MKLILKILSNIKNLLPYLFLIAIYFIFVNIEAKKENNKNILDYKNTNVDNNVIQSKKGTSKNSPKQMIIEIPVIQFTE